MRRLGWYDDPLWDPEDDPEQDPEEPNPPLPFPGWDNPETYDD